MQAVRSIRAEILLRMIQSNIDTDHFLVLLVAVSIFAPFYVSVAAVICIAFWVIVHNKIREKAFSTPYTRLIFIFLVVSFFIAAIYNNFLGMCYSMLIYALVVCGLYFRSIMTRELFDLTMDAACVGSIWSFVVAAIQKISMYSIQPDFRPASVFCNTNYYGMMIEFVVLIALYRAFSNPKRAGLYYTVIVLNLEGLALTASYSSSMALFCAAIVMLLAHKKIRPVAIILATVFVAVVVYAAFPSLLPRGSDALDLTVSLRFNIWHAALRGIQESPFFGRGAMAYPLIAKEFNSFQTIHCHNLLLDILLNFGIFGLAVIVFYLGVQIRLMVLRFRSHIENPMNILLLSVFVAVFVHGLTDVTILWIQTAALFFLIYSCSGIGSEQFEQKLSHRLLPDTVGEPRAIAFQEN